MLMVKKVNEIVDRNDFISFLSFRFYRTLFFHLEFRKKRVFDKKGA